MDTPNSHYVSGTYLSADIFLRREINGTDAFLPLTVFAVLAEQFSAVKEKLIRFYGKDYAAETAAGVFPLAALPYAAEIFLPGKPFIERVRHNFTDLVEIMFRLRDPDGCPWDRAQTHLSIRGNAVEEAYELVEAIELNDNAKMLEESGDVLLQALFHATIAEEEGAFSVQDMITGLTQKLISRHTHIFGENKADGADDALKFWEKAKAVEKGYRSVADQIDSIPRTFSALMHAHKAQKIIKKTGFDFADAEGAREKVLEELEELFSAFPEHREEEGGDLLFAAVNVLRLMKIDPEIALTRTTGKFVRRFLYIEQKAQEKGIRVEEFSIDEMEAYYQEYKRLYENRQLPV